MTNLKKLSAVVLGSLLAIGVGTGVVAHNNNAQATHAADVVDSFSVKGFGGYTTASYTSTAYTAAGATSGVTFELNNYNGSTGQIRGNQTPVASNFYIRNTTEYTGYYISKISLTVTGGTLTGANAGYCVVAYGTSAIAASNTTGTAKSDQNASLVTNLTWTVADPATSKYTYFCVNNIRTSGTVLAAATTAVQVTWTQAAASSKVLTDELELSGSLTNTTQYAGSTLNVAGLTINAVYDDASTSPLSASQLTLPTLVFGTNSYQISYTEGSVTATAMISVTVAQDTAASLSWTGRVATFNEGSVFTLGTGAVEVTRASGAKAAVTLANLTVFLFEGTFDAATSPVLAPATTLQLADNGKSIVLGFEGVYTTASTITVKFVATTTYGSATGATLVTNVANLAAGDSIVIANIAANTALGPSGGTYRTNVPVTIADNQITSLGSATILTLGGATGAWTLSNGTEYLYYSGSSNTLQTGTSASSGNTWNISISSGVTTIANVTTPARVIQYDSSTPRFSCYTSGQADIAIFKISGGFNYDYILGMLDGDYCTCTLDELDLISTRYAAMTAHEQDYLNSVTIVGKDSNSYTGLEAFNAAMARRAALHAQAAKTSVFGANISDTSVIAIITIISIVGVSAIGGFFYFRKKHLA